MFFSIFSHFFAQMAFLVLKIKKFAIQFPDPIKWIWKILGTMNAIFTKTTKN
jgi:hypothetical protein